MLTAANPACANDRWTLMLLKKSPPAVVTRQAGKSTPQIGLHAAWKQRLRVKRPSKISRIVRRRLFQQHPQTADSRGVPVRHRYKGTGTHTAPDSGWPPQSTTAARPASDRRPSRLVIKWLRTTK